MSFLRAIAAAASAAVVLELREEIAHTTKAALRAVKKTIEDRRQ